MNIQHLRNSIVNTLTQHDADDIKGITNDMLSLFICEAWTHNAGTFISVNDLTDSEFRMLVTWTEMSAAHYNNRLQHIKDMREIFPGLSLAAANYFTRMFHNG